MEIITLSEAQEYVNRNKNSGIVCPCCGQFAKQYRRKLTSIMAVGIIFLYRATKNGETDEDGFVYMPEAVVKYGSNVKTKRSSDWTKLVHWKLIESKPEVRDDKSPRTGYYRITAAGESFVKGNLSVKSYVNLYNNEVIGYDYPKVSIYQTLGAKFNYRELMDGI